MTRYRLLLEYDGTDFQGWQLQSGAPMPGNDVAARTLQGAIEGAVERVVGHPVRVHTAGRTDAGVHARGQVVRFDSDREIGLHRMRNALNGLLKPDIACLDADVAPPDFDPRRWKHTKQYRYRWLDRYPPSPLRHRTVWHLRYPLDVSAMAEAAAFVRGKHDFSCFRASGCASAHPIRTVERCDVLRVDDEVHLVVEGTGFLRHMIRILAGSLTEVGKGKRPPGWIGELIDGRDRQLAGRTAPPGGLTLEWIRYHDRPAAAEPAEAVGEEGSEEDGE